MRIQSALGVFHVFESIYLYGGPWPICAFRQKADTHIEDRQTKSASGQMRGGRELNGTGGSIINAAVTAGDARLSAELVLLPPCRRSQLPPALQYSLFTLARTIRHDLELDLSVASRQLDLASSRPFARHGPLLPPHRSSHPLQAQAVGCDHISPTAMAYCKLPRQSRRSSRCPAARIPGLMTNVTPQLTPSKVRLAPGSPQDSG